MTARALIFDLDGTLADTLVDIGAAMNHALAHLGLPIHPPSAYRALVGEGVDRLAERALPADRQDARPALLRAYVERYAEHMLDESRPYPGVPELLDALAQRGVPCAVLSNKPDAATRRMVAALFGRWSFRVVLGQRAGVPRKPDPTAALEIARTIGVAPTDCAFVGDTGIDVETARAAGMQPIAVLWGLRDRDELIASGAVTLVERPAAILDLV